MSGLWCTVLRCVDVVDGRVYISTNFDVLIHDWQYDVRRMNDVVVDAIESFRRVCMIARTFAGVGIDIKEWEVATRNIQPYTMAFLKTVRGSQ